MNNEKRIAYLNKRLKSINNPEAIAKVKAAIDSLTPKRARDEDGQYIGDDKSTPNYNEAWKSGKSPKKKKSR